MTNLYVAQRDDICVGKVITDFNITDEKVDISGTRVKLGAYYKYRSMLFVKDQNNCAIDLLYNSPKYPIFSQENAEVCRDSKVIIDQAYNLSELLKYFHYGEEFTYWGVEGIRKRFFDGKFPLENYSLFGLIQIDPATQTYYDSKGKEIFDKKILDQIIKEVRHRQYWSRSQVYDYDPDIPSYVDLMSKELFEILREHGNKTFYDVWHEYEDKMNAFKPHIEEGPIRSRKNTTF